MEHFFQSLVNTSGMTLHIRQVENHFPAINFIPRGQRSRNNHLFYYLIIKLHFSSHIFFIQLAGNNSHHIIEATFKAFARALRQATESDPRRHGTVPRYESYMFQRDIIDSYCLISFSFI